MKILAIIPARSGSKGIPNKNIKSFNGYPLIYYAIKLAKEAEKKGVITAHIVSTNDKKIASIAKEIGGNIPFLRPRKLATDNSPIIDTVIHAVNWWEEKHRDVIHSFLLLQPTNPLTSIEDIENSARYYIDNQPKARCLISVCSAQYVRLSTLYYKKGRYLKQALKQVDPLTRRQNLRNLYWRNGAIYISRRDLFLEDRKVINDNPLFYEMSRFRSVAIDDMFDWTIAEYLMKHKKSL
jgi:CMP-N-acetylneuraminic acid synthetase